MNNKNTRRLRGYYGFSKKYPTQRGTVYAIGESRKMKKKELRNKICVTVLIFAVLIAALILFFFCRDLSQRPIPQEIKTGNSTALSAENIGQIKALFIENSVLADESALSKKLDEAKNNGFNSIIIDFKDEDGTVLFPCSSAAAALRFDGKNRISQSTLEQIRSEGFTVIARIYCFRDSLAPQRTGAYVYADAERTEPWFDAPSALSGRVWLNPADARAKNYLLSVIREAAEFGADCIYLDGVEFPVSSENPPVFSEDDASLSRNFILLNFIEKAAEKSGKRPIILGFAFEGIDGDTEKWGGTLFDSAAAASSPEIPVSENYAKYAGDIWKVLNERAKNNFSTLKCIPTVKDQPENEHFYRELNENGAQSYIIIP